MSLTDPIFIALQVRDPEASSTSYTDQLGLVCAKLCPPRAVLFDSHPIPIQLQYTLVDLDATKPLGHGVAFWLRCDSSATLLAELEMYGLKIVRPLGRDGTCAETFTFQDPDGYLMTMHDAG